MILSRPVKAPQKMNRMLEVSIVYTSPRSDVAMLEGVFPERFSPVRTRPGRCLSEI